MVWRESRSQIASGASATLRVGARLVFEFVYIITAGVGRERLEKKILMRNMCTEGVPEDILATAVVPWTQGWEFDELMFSRLVKAIAAQLSRDIYIFGTAGEGYAVSERQFEQVARVFKRVADECGVRPMLGVISLSLKTVTERIAVGREIGYRRFQLSLPSWGELNDHELDVFFQETCGRFPDCQFLHYNVSRAGRLLKGEEYIRIVESFPNLVAVKSGASEPAAVADLLTASSRLRFFFTESGYAFARRFRDDVGLLVSVASVAPEQAWRLVRGGADERGVLNDDLQEIVRKLLEMGLGRFHMDGAYDKLFARCLIPDFPLRLLPPYRGADLDDFARWSSTLPERWRPAFVGSRRL